MTYHPEYMDRIDTRAFKRAKQRQQMMEWLFIATIFAAGLVSGWAITIATTTK